MSQSSSSVPYDPRFAAKIKNSSTQILHLQDSVLACRRDLGSLKATQEKARLRHQAKNRLNSWRTMYDIGAMPDGRLRAPDKAFNVRAYSNMDRDMWDGGSRGETLRGWFQKFAEARGREIWNAQNEGYLVPSGYQKPPQMEKINHYQSRILNRR